MRSAASLPRWAVALGLLALAGCKMRGKDAQGPTPTTIDEAERMLAANRDALEAEGIVVPTTVAAAEPVPRHDSSRDHTTQEVAPEVTNEPDEGADEDEGGDVDVPAEPEPSPDPEPVAPTISEADDEDLGVSPAAPPRESVSRRRFDRRLRAERVTDRKKRKESRTRCERVCDLADATCQLQDRICGLADQHVTDIRYEEACARAELQCDAADRACQLCDGSTAWLDPRACGPEIVSREP